MKKLIKLALAITLILSFFALNKQNAFASAVQPKAYFLIDYNTKTVISSHNENEKLPIASMTKIMLLNLIYKNEKNSKINFEDEIIVSENASSMGGSQVFLERNGKYKIKDLVKAITVASANDASVAMAEALYGSEENCVKEMNNEALRLNLKNTQFQNCTGLSKPMHYSSAKDIATLFCELISYDKYFEFSKVWLDKINHSKNFTEITNTNKLVKYYEGCDGGKTGFTNEAGFCLTATAKRGNMRLVACVIGADSSKNRFKCVSDLFNEGFNTYTNKCVLDKNIPLDEKATIIGGKKDKIEIICKNSFFIFTKKQNNPNVKVINEISKLKAPIKKGDIVGESIVFKDGVEIGRVNLISNETVKCKTYFDYISDIVTNF